MIPTSPYMTFHGVDNETPAGILLEKFRIRFSYLKVMVYDQWQVYGPYHLKYRDSMVKEAEGIANELGLKVETSRVNYQSFTLIIKG